jgi:pantoate kinase
MSVKLFVPSHITGFFNIENNQNLLKKGSCGGGFLLNKGVKTTIKTNIKDELSIKINGIKDSYNEVIINEVLNILDIDTGISINQEIQVPIGSGFGTSASSAIGVAIGASKLLDLNNSLTESGQIAHLAEIKLGSGLGDVIAEMSKGIVLRVKPGAPGYGEIKNLKIDEKVYVGIKTLGKIPTSSIIQNQDYIYSINKTGADLKNNLLKSFSIDNFLKLSLEFASKTKLIETEVKNLIEIFDSQKNILGASMAMLGNTAFAFSYDKNSFKELNIPDLEIYKINNKGIEQ